MMAVLAVLAVISYISSSLNDSVNPYTTPVLAVDVS